MGLSTEIRRRLIETFKVEQAEHIQHISQGLLSLEKTSDPAARQQLLNDIFRAAHSLKGAARAIGFSTIESLGHALEDRLLAARDGQLILGPEQFDLLYQILDAVEASMAQVESGNPAASAAVLSLLAQLETEAELRASDLPSTSPELETARPLEMALGGFETPSLEVEGGITGPLLAATPVVNQTEETIRVSVGKLDTLMAQFSELLGAKIRAEQRLAEVRQLQAIASGWQKEWIALYSNHGRLRPGRREASATLASPILQPEKLRAFNSQINMLYRQFANDTMRLSLVIDELQEEIKRIRMLPLSTITTTFGRMIRDLAREQGKAIEFKLIGGETELDKRVLEQIKDPLIHLLRNAADHGIESPAERQAAGKAAEGQIWLEASQQGSNVVIAVRDDGRGLDLEAIRLVAVRKGLMSPAEVQKLNETDTAHLIFSSGLSTSKIITGISGRGVGMDVVRQNVEELHGILQVDFVPGGGTSFILTLPLTLVSSRGLLVRVSDQTFALPLTTVERMLHVKRDQITSVEGQEAMTYLGKPVALVWLADLLELARPARESETLTVVIVAVAEKRLGLIVDDLTGEQEIVMKSLGRQLSRVGGIAGATILGSGQVILVLHAADLIKLATRTRSQPRVLNAPAHPEEINGKTILVVDDSITTRTLEKNILEAAGYVVKLATNGEEALGLLVSEALPDLIISDINMPRLDGFDLTRRVKRDNRYSHIPVILVTSLDSPADKARGIEVGADAYIVKSQFDQGDLLETIAQLI
jgi:two-component system chemotaxis sensor kinase CheA